VRSHVALLRSVNVGKTQVAMADLRRAFEAVGATDVATYVQSGNVVFTTKTREPELIAAIEARIARVTGFQVAVVLRKVRELRKVLAANPFLTAGADPAALHVTFLRDPPAPATARDVAALSVDVDEFRIVGREVFVHCPNGYGKTKLNNAFFERKLGVAATTRNWRTVNAIVQLAGA
jgi:uncharacterized protein (DUF1697 family)